MAFLDGDPDRPVVTGCLYNGARRTPFDLPGDLGRSGWRSDSLGGHGYNELSFEDTAGHEQVRVRAQHNLDVDVGHDRAVAVGHDDRARVHGDQTLHVGGARTTNVVGDDLRTVHGQERARGSRTPAPSRSSAPTPTHRGPARHGDRRVVQHHRGHLAGARRAGELHLRRAPGRRVGSARAERRAGGAGAVREDSIELRPDRIVLRAPRVEVAAGERAEVTGGGFVAHVQGDLDLVARRVRASAAGASAVLTNVVRLRGRRCTSTGRRRRRRATTPRAMSRRRGRSRCACATRGASPWRTGGTCW